VRGAIVNIRFKVSVALLIWLSISSQVVAESIDSYLSKVIEKRYAMKESFAGLQYDATSYRRNVNGDWEILSEQIWEKEVYARDFDTRHQRVFSIIEDGSPLEEKKILKEVERLVEKSEEKKDERRFMEPLDTLYYGDYEFSFGEPDSSAPEYDRIDFRAVVRDDKHVDGYILVNPEDYGIVYTEFELADRPTGVKYMKIASELEQLNNGHYYPVRTFFRGHFGVLFFNGRREVIEEFSNFRFGQEFPDSLFDVPIVYQPR